jgi:plastocyanin
MKEDSTMRRTILIAALVAALATAAGSAAAYEAIAVTDGGTLAGVVKYAGTPPPPTKVEVSKDPEVCAKDGNQKIDLTKSVIVGAGGGLADTVVVVQATKGKKPEVPAQNPVFDQKGCEFHPHVLAFPAGSTIDVLNSDGILHNIHTFSTVNPATNQAQPKFKPKIQIKIEKPEWPIKVQCDAHGWMHGYWLSMDQPYYAVTAADGSFKIDDIPPGDYDVEVWNPVLGKKTEKVSIKPKQETKVTWELASAG